jgi:hypothetical protein
MLCTLSNNFHFQHCDIRNLIAHAHKKGGVGEVGDPFLDRAAHVTLRTSSALGWCAPRSLDILAKGSAFRTCWRPRCACDAVGGCSVKTNFEEEGTNEIACDACMLYSRPQQSWLIGLQQRQEGDPRAYTSQRNATHVSARALSCVILSTLRLSLP